MNTIDWIARILVIIGALNWGLAIFDVNVVALLSVGWLMTLVYALVGLSGIWELINSRHSRWILAEGNSKEFTIFACYPLDKFKGYLFIPCILCNPDPESFH